MTSGLYNGFIQQRKLAPFYKGLEDWDDSEDAQEEKESEKGHETTIPGCNRMSHLFLVASNPYLHPRLERR
ncbi:hypothetical protein BCR41DRAFT_427139 [Lobosporangium transversale]|uniref:Uncharacterized protein n=1 Tax=Lobosporangium transversale TaxID=64571 RepID=A0A1Y2FWF7_9FUNG|nr:hypothetical protein BCR41DRAFT_427139 [Lobosporangium transversale]ORY88362.1 hypothetical protein BCR41DRAFT_427139 [Lobosporangium transversale]|eukprot:XP_021874989.1 hypothetical protein BCR41DRAFT_427139 [Lobosporangium transversale]